MLDICVLFSLSFILELFSSKLVVKLTSALIIARFHSWYLARHPQSYRVIYWDLRCQARLASSSSAVVATQHWTRRSHRSAYAWKRENEFFVRAKNSRFSFEETWNKEEKRALKTNLGLKLFLTEFIALFSFRWISKIYRKKENLKKFLVVIRYTVKHIQHTSKIARNIPAKVRQIVLEPNSNSSMCLFTRKLADAMVLSFFSLLLAGPPS